MYSLGLSGNPRQDTYAGQRPVRAEKAGTSEKPGSSPRQAVKPIPPPPVSPALVASKKSKTAVRSRAAVGYQAARNGIATG